MPPEPELVGGEVLPAVIEHPAAPGLFRTDDPDLFVAGATAASDLLARVIHDRKLFVRINGKEHVLVGGWTLLGSMLGVFPVTVWSRQLDDGWEARVEARTLDGRVVGAAESECLRSERRWAKADDYAIRSMAQTRATSKALRMPLGFVMELAGFDATPADEVPTGEPAVPPEDAPPRDGGGPIPDSIKPTDAQRDKILALIRSLGNISPQVNWADHCQKVVGADWNHTTRTMAGRLIEKLQAEFGALVEGEPPDGRSR